MTSLEKRVEALEKKINDMATNEKESKKRKVVNRAPSKYNIFMKQTLIELKKSKPDMTHAERFTECAKLWKERKE